MNRSDKHLKIKNLVKVENPEIMQQPIALSQANG
jgi:hypothetical protein